MKRAQFKHICLVGHNSAWFKEPRGCRQNRHGEERNDAAIQWSLDLAAMDCFAPLAMTARLKGITWPC